MRGLSASHGCPERAEPEETRHEVRAMRRVCHATGARLRPRARWQEGVWRTYGQLAARAASGCRLGAGLGCRRASPWALPHHTQRRMFVCLPGISAPTQGKVKFRAGSDISDDVTHVCFFISIPLEKLRLQTCESQQLIESYRIFEPRRFRDATVSTGGWSSTTGNATNSVTRRGSRGASSGGGPFHRPTLPRRRLIRMTDVPNGRCGLRGARFHR